MHGNVFGQNRLTVRGFERMALWTNFGIRCPGWNLDIGLCTGIPLKTHGEKDTVMLSYLERASYYNQDYRLSDYYNQDYDYNNHRRAIYLCLWVMFLPHLRLI